MFSPRRFGKVFLALLLLSPFYVGCSKSKSALDEESTLSDTSSCLDSEAGCDFDFSGTGTGGGSGSGSGTATGTGTGTGSGTSSLTNPNLNNSDFIGTPSGTVSAQQQQSCYSNLGFQYGLNNTGSNYAQNFNQSSWFNQGQANPQASCLATNMSQGTAANLGVATYTQQNNCTNTAYQVLRALTGNSTAPNLMARRISIMAYARCMLDLTQQQTQAVQWTQNNLTSYGYIQYYLSQFIQMLSRSSWN